MCECALSFREVVQRVVRVTTGKMIDIREADCRETHHVLIDVSR